MPLGPREVPKPVHEESLGSLRSCLVEGDAEQRRCERRVRRRALISSTLIQTAALVLFLLLSLFGKTERIALAKNYVPIPPYGHPSSRPEGERRSANPRPSNPGSRFTFDVHGSRPRTSQATDSGSGFNSSLDPLGSSQGEGPSCSGCVDIGANTSGPRPPQQETVQTPPQRRIINTTIDPAMLIRRIEPVYPPLARQIHKEGRVEMRAIIATDGTIQSLEIVSGDPMFYQSAKEAVIQWRYKPTILNGQPVEIDTYISVVYTLQH